MSVVDNLHQVQQRIAQACERVGRTTDEVRLLAVSKTKPTSMVRELHRAGVTRFGENKVQELVRKAVELSDELGLEWAAIGHLQTNKARDVAQHAAEFQALDSLKLARELDKRLNSEGRQLDVLLQVNSSGEPSKWGLSPDQVTDCARELGAFDALRPRGLMTLAAHSDNDQQVRNCFDTMLQVQDRLRQAGVGDGEWTELSMGMSNDFELAIEHGSTCVRIGTGIFGPRE